MLDVLTAAQQRLFDPQAPQDVAIATVIATDGSVPRPIGTSMLVDASGGIHGSLTGGCVEGAVLDACVEALATGVPAVHRFGYSDEDAFAVGLMCGGSIDVLISPIAVTDRDLLGETDLLSASVQPASTAMVLRIPAPADSAGTDSSELAGQTPPGPRGGAAVVRAADPDSLLSALTPLVPTTALRTAATRLEAMIRSGSTGRLRLAAQSRADSPAQSRADSPLELSRADSPVELFVETRIRPAHLVVFGANAFGQALVEAARPLGFRITLCDPRPAFTDPAAFPAAEVVRAWPHRFLAEAAESGEFDERSMICVLTHDPKVDVPALTRALELDVAYVGAMGSRRSDRDRRAALREAGVGEEALRRLHSPIGLGLDASTPAEVAVSILAEILAVRARRTTIEPLSRGSGPLHSLNP